MKRALSCCFFLLPVLLAMGQERIRPRAEACDTGSLPAACIFIQQPPQLVQEAVLHYIKPAQTTNDLQQGYKGSNAAFVKGDGRMISFTLLLDTGLLNERSGTKVRLLVSTDDAKAPASEDVLRSDLKEAMAFLDSFSAAVNKYALNLFDAEIERTAAALKKSETNVKKSTLRYARISNRKENLQPKVARHFRSAIRRDGLLARRLSASRNTMVYHRRELDKHWSTLAQLSVQRKAMDH
jgi:hypothetical protein